MVQWYAIRASGVVALILLTATIILGLLNRSRLASERWPRFTVDALHRNLALLTVAFLCLHIVTAVTDAFVPVAPLSAFIPFQGSYRPFWVGLGAVAGDAIFALIVSSLLRVRLGLKVWRGIHWLAYLAWPVAVVHELGIGTDSGRPWMLVIELVCILSVLAALAVRLSAASRLTEQVW